MRQGIEVKARGSDKGVGEGKGRRNKGDRDNK